MEKVESGKIQKPCQPIQYRKLTVLQKSRLGGRILIGTCPERLRKLDSSMSLLRQELFAEHARLALEGRQARPRGNGPVSVGRGHSESSKQHKRVQTVYPRVMQVNRLCVFIPFLPGLKLKHSEGHMMEIYDIGNISCKTPYNFTAHTSLKGTPT